MAVKRRSSLSEIAEAAAERLEAVEALVGGKVGKPARAERPDWVTPSIQMTEDQLHLLRAVAQRRAGRGRVSISAVVQKLIEDSRAALEAEAGGRKA
jgi:hypothetical protein